MQGNISEGIFPLSMGERERVGSNTEKAMCPRFEVMLEQINKQIKTTPVHLSREKGA